MAPVDVVVVPLLAAADDAAAADEGSTTGADVTAGATSVGCTTSSCTKRHPARVNSSKSRANLRGLAWRTSDRTIAWCQHAWLVKPEYGSQAASQLRSRMMLACQLHTHTCFSGGGGGGVCTGLTIRTPLTATCRSCHWWHMHLSTWQNFCC